MALIAAAPSSLLAQTAPTASNPNSNPDHALKLIVVGRRKPGSTLAEHRQHIRRVHGELVLSYIAARPEQAPRRYAQHQVIDGQFRPSAPGSDPFALNRDFVTQIWFPDMATLARSVQTDFYRDRLKGDEENFVDQKTVVFMPTTERVISSRRAAAPTATVPGTKLFFFVKRAEGADPRAFAAAWSAAAAALQPSGLSGRIERHVQNDAMPGPQGLPPADGIDEFWVDDEASARALLTQWQALLRTRLVAPGLAIDSSLFGLLAQEELIHAGSR